MCRPARLLFVHRHHERALGSMLLKQGGLKQCFSRSHDDTAWVSDRSQSAAIIRSCTCICPLVA